ncbi:MAG: ferrochelatase [Bradymonadales bacterium]|nr:MAG: ferrochelatase [Bradymonadales bacterium]
MQKKGIWLIQLGSPRSPKRGDVAAYLREFLSDPRMIQLPSPLRWGLVNCIIAPFRSKKSAAAYSSIWGKNGSPLVTHSEDLAVAIQKRLPSDIWVELSMRYGSPSIEQGWQRIKERGVTDLKILPLFPQYSFSTSASVFDAISNIWKSEPVLPNHQFFSFFYQHEAFIEAFAQVGENFDFDAYDHILMSYHGLPESYVKQTGKECLLNERCCDRIDERNAFCYRAQCFDSSRRLMERLKIPKNKVTVCFQSRLSGPPWIRPFTDHVVLDLAKQSCKRLLVFCPSFVADCLETIEEIGIRAREDFVEAGGEELTLVPSLNAHPAWVEACLQILKEKPLESP